MFVKGNKFNIYKISPRIYRKFLNNKIIMFYKRTIDNYENNINSEAKNISHNLNIDGRMCKKDHKYGFETNSFFRLLNPSQKVNWCELVRKSYKIFVTFCILMLM